VGSAATGTLVTGTLVADTAVGAGVGDPQAATSRPLISMMNVNEVFVLVNISLPFELDETGK
jgi:hypothetical protein